MLPAAPLALVIAASTLLAIVVRPRGLSEGLVAMVGAVLMVASGLVSPFAALQVVRDNADVFFFFAGMLSLTALAEQAGIFLWLATWAARRAHGRQYLLFLNVFLLGTVISTFLTNDATALILSPVVYTTVRLLDLQRLTRDISWSIFPFVAGLFIVVSGVERVGLTAPIGHLLHMTDHNLPLTALIGTAVSAVGTNLINNVPMALVLVSAIGAPHGATGHTLVYSALLGCDLGPNLTITGSLSTMIWLLLLRRRGLEISALSYLRLGLLVTPPMLLVGALLIGLTAS